MITSGMAPTEITWHKSSFSTGQNDCVEVAHSGAAVLIRDSKNPGGGHLTVSKRTWGSLICRVKDGRPA
jgi:hypothetical protein